MSDNPEFRIRNRAQIDGRVVTPDTTEITVLIQDADGKIILAHGTTVPTDTEAGFAKGCTFLDSNGGVGTTFYVNEGSTTSCDFNLAASEGGGASTFAALTDTPANYAGAGDKMLKVNTGATAVEFVTPSGAVTMNATGVFAFVADQIVNADINSAAAIVLSKLESVTDARLIVGSAGNVPTAVDITGDLAIDNAGVTTVTNLTIAGETNGDVLFFTGGVWTRIAATSLPAGTASVLAQSTTIEAGAFDVTLSTTSQTVGTTALTIPDFANVSDVFTFNTLASVLLNKTLDDATTKFGDTGDPTKDLFFSLGGATANKTMTIISSQTDDRSLTLPDATDTLVGKATTDVFTNKTHTSPIFNGTISGDAFLDENDLVSDSAIKLASQQSIKAYVDAGVVTFTNKTIDADGTGNTISNINGDELDPIALTNANYGIPIIIPIVNAGSTDIDVFTGNVPFKCRVIDAWAINTQAGNAGNWKLQDGVADITETVGYGASDNALTRCDAILDANHTLDADDLHLISSNGADLAIVYVSVIREA